MSATGFILSCAVAVVTPFEGQVTNIVPVEWKSAPAVISYRTVVDVDGKYYSHYSGHRPLGLAPGVRVLVKGCGDRGIIPLAP
jgi:hypothetical protein